MRALFIIIGLIVPVSLIAAETKDPALWSADGGELSITFYRSNLRDAGLSVAGTRKLDFQHDVVTLEIPNRGSLEFRTTTGYFQKLVGGSLPMNAGLTISAGNFSLKSEQLRIEPKPRTRDSLRLSDASGESWFYLDYGHYERDGQWLFARYLDLRIGPALANHLGDRTLSGFMLGFATLKTRVSIPPGMDKGITSSCPTTAPNWPTEPGFDADIAMLKMDSVNQIARAGGRVALAPSAYFENIGNADVPWFAQFADTRNVDACCADQGDGVCAPYGNDQGGILVYALYRFVDGRLEQLGRSQAKHAFNSVNIDTTDGNVVCQNANRGGRVVPAGCEDLYQASTNANQFFLGPREEVIAHTGEWLRAGSIWDLNSDDNCDFAHSGAFAGQVPCQAPVADAMDRRLSVAESELSTPGARYFSEAWYVVRDDIDIFNSFGRKEVNPTFSTAWTFPQAVAFQQGPVVDEYLTLQNANAASLADTVDTGEGHVRLTSSVNDLGGGQWQYDIALMNFDFDRAIEQFDIPVPSGVNVMSSAFFDGDADGANDWSISDPSVNGILTFKAPDGMSLNWGSLVSFRFVADREPLAITGSLGVAQAGSPSTLNVRTFTGTDLLFRDSFE